MNELKYNSIYRAKVLATDSAESVKAGRIKVEVYPMLIGEDTAANLKRTNPDTEVTGIETSLMPWAVPAMPILCGSGDDVGHFAVPQVGSFVWVFFENGDINQPVYFAEAPNALKGLPTERSTDYPNTKVLKTASGIIFSINQKEGSEQIQVTHPTGTVVQIDSSGAVLVTAIGNVAIAGNVAVTGTITADGDITGNNFVSDGINVDFNTHIHTGDSGGNTGPPK